MSPVKNLLALLAHGDRLALLALVNEAYQARLLDHLKIVRAEVATAVPLGDEKRRAIERGLGGLTGRTVSLTRRWTPGSWVASSRGSEARCTTGASSANSSGCARSWRAVPDGRRIDMDIKADEISKIIRDQIGSFAVQVDVAEVGSVITIGDGIARVTRCREGDGRRDARLRPRRLRHRAQPRRGQRRDRPAGRVSGRSRKGIPSSAPVASSPCRSAKSCSAAWSTRSASRSTARVRSDQAVRAGRAHRAGRGRASAGARAGADRAQGDRLDDPDRTRPARTHHRRPADREDGHRGRHDHQPEGPRRHLHLQRDRAEDVDDRTSGQDVWRKPARWTTPSSWRPRHPTPRRCCT